MPLDSVSSAADADAGLVWSPVALPARTVLWMLHKGAEYEAAVVDGVILFQGQGYSPNGFAAAVTGRPTNAWSVVWMRRPDDADFVLADDARAAVRGERRPARSRPAARGPAKSAAVSLVPFLVRAGGLRDDRGDVLALLGGKRSTRPGLVSPSGLALDRAVEMALESGYFPTAGAGRSGKEAENLVGKLASAGADECPVSVRDLLDAIDWELRGRLSWPDGLAPESVPDADREAHERSSAAAEDAGRWQRLVALARDAGPEAALAFLSAQAGPFVAPAPAGGFDGCSDIDDCPF